jgi:hypothetical protein
MTAGRMGRVIASAQEYQRWMTHLQSLPMVALVTTGRTGSDFLQSLLDSHPQIVTFNGHFAVYSEFFTRALTFSVVGGRAADAADEFIGQYLYKLVSRYDIQEAKDRLGEHSDESFTLDTAEFKAHLVGLMGERPLTSRDFLLAVYGAYNLCLGQQIVDAKVIFHHPHLDYEFRLFLKDFPKTRVVFSSRDPRANFCSHVEHFRRYYSSHDNQQHVYNCLKMALEDSALAEELGLDYIATRLEDIPREDVMRAFASWLGVDFQESMLRSTWAGLDWHGDRISNKTFAATGWSETRTENGWQQRLGRIDKYVLNYIMNDRLRWYRYPVRPVRPVDAVLAAMAILLPFRCERRFFFPRHVWTTLRSGSNQMRLQLLLTPVFYGRRVQLCYRHYLRTLRGVKFTGNWIQAPGQPGNP